MHIFGRKTPKSVPICYLWLSIEVRLALWRWALGKMSASIALLWPSENVPQVSEVMIIRVIVEVLCEPSIVDFQGERVFSKKGSDAIELDSAWQCLTRSNILNYLILQLHSMFSSTLTITIKLILNQWGLTPMWRVIPSYRNLLSGSLWEHAAMYGVSLARQPHPEPGSIHSTDPLCLRALAWWPDVWPDVQMHLRCLRCCLHYHPSVPGSWGHCQCLEGSWFDGENSHFNAC